MNAFQRCLEKAEEAKRTHHQRREAQVRAHYERHPECGVGVDVEKRCKSGWWQDAGLWPDDRDTEEITTTWIDSAEVWNRSGIYVYAPIYVTMVIRKTERDVIGRVRRQCERIDLLDGVGDDEPVQYETLWADYPVAA